jgi:hypothetical protein
MSPINLSRRMMLSGSVAIAGALAASTVKTMNAPFLAKKADAVPAPSTGAW